MAVLTVQTLKWGIKTTGTICDADADVNCDGLTVTRAAAAAGGDSFANDGRTYLSVKNTSGSNAYDVVFACVKKNDFGMSRNLVLKVPASANVIVDCGPFLAAEFNDANGRVAITYSGSAPATDLTVAAIKLTETGR